MMTNDLISREELLEYFGYKESYLRELPFMDKEADIWQAAFEAVQNASAVDAAPVVHGRWTFPWTSPECSVCKKTQKWTSKFCPNCGARMDKETDDAQE